MDEVNLISISLSIVSMIIGILSHVKHSKCSNCCEIDFNINDNV
jgi:hypothetical protein